MAAYIGTHGFSLVSVVHLVVFLLAVLLAILPTQQPDRVLAPVLVAVPPSVALVVWLVYSDCLGAQTQFSLDDHRGDGVTLSALIC